MFKYIINKYVSSKIKKIIPEGTLINENLDVTEAINLYITKGYKTAQVAVLTWALKLGVNLDGIGVQHTATQMIAILSAKLRGVNSSLLLHANYTVKQINALAKGIAELGASKMTDIANWEFSVAQITAFIDAVKNNVEIDDLIKTKASVAKISAAIDAAMKK